MNAVMGSLVAISGEIFTHFQMQNYNVDKILNSLNVTRNYDEIHLKINKFFSLRTSYNQQLTKISLKKWMMNHEYDFDDYARMTRVKKV